MKLYRYRTFKSEEIEFLAPITHEKTRMEQWKIEAFEGMLRPSSPLFFNDPNDCTFCFEWESVINVIARKYCIEVLSKKITLSEHDKNIIRDFKDVVNALEVVLRPHYKRLSLNRDELYNRIRTESEDKLKDAVRVVCLSELYDSMLMWSHYAENHTGFCIEYDFNESDEFFHYLYKVDYSKDRYVISSQDIENNKHEWMYKAICQKSDVWSYEKEWRIVIPNYKVVKPDVLKSPTTETVLNVKDNIVAFYLGSKISDAHKNEIIQFGKTNAIPVYQMVLSSKSYELKAQQVL